MNPADINTNYLTELTKVAESNDGPFTFGLAFDLDYNNGSKLSVPSAAIHGVDILQDYIAKYSDVTLISLSLELADVIDIYKNRSNITCSLKLYDIESNGQLSDTPRDIIEFMAIPHNMEELANYASMSELIAESERTGTPSAEIPVELELVSQEVFLARKKKISTILEDVTMAEVIFYVVETFGFKQVYFEPPDNTTRYRQVIIPPLQGIEATFDYLQNNNSYGVYLRGLNYYYTKGILYITKLTDSHPNGKVLVAYNSSGLLMDSGNTFNVGDSSKLSIILSTEIDIVNEVASNAENVGSAFIVNNPHKTFDLQGSIVDNGLFNVNQDFLKNNYIATTNLTNTIADNWNMQYLYEDNMYRVRSKIAELEVVYVQGKWANSVPYVITPATGVIYKFDNEDELTENHGWVDSVQYFIKPSGSKYAGNVFSCDAGIKIATADFLK